MQAGRSKELSAVYSDVLARSQNPRVRNYVSHRLARLQAQPANVDQAIATLRKNLDENLANDAKQRTEREKMRANWQQQRGQKSISPATTSN
jgi:predicted negative regulator of RcsB-dependent stress response